MLTIVYIFVPPFGMIKVKVFNTISETRKYLGALASNNISVGFVPTMGALHPGHLSLVRQAMESNNIVVVSVFVNPIQFNDPKDLQKYPIRLEKDLGLLNNFLSSDDFVFVPSIEEMYPSTVKKKYDFGYLGEVMEGLSRPGHFNGVGIVVDRLFRIVQPERAYFGEKDFQQLAIIRKMVELENHPINIIGCPIIREDDGLAMSSRNQLLSSSLRKNAGVLYQSLLKAQSLSAIHTVEETCELITRMINAMPGFKLEYVEFADERTLRAINNWIETDAIRCFIAVLAGKIRLIDNIKIEPPSK